ncbi:hypothetical protein N752_20890 [Desulforamulus aquiferis]|nr:hypothetical protein N752_20890 [Desulforamulus aquiferis]
MKGIGTDIIEIERVELAISRSGQEFLNRVFTLENKVIVGVRYSAWPADLLPRKLC